MTREEIENIPELVDLMLDESITVDTRMKLHKRLEELCKLAIKALEQEPCEDAISRQAVLEIIEDRIKNGLPQNVAISQYYHMEVEKLPPVTPQQKSGKWLITPMSRVAYCSECDHLVKNIPASVVKYFKYCPNCKVKMTESEEV